MPQMMPLNWIFMFIFFNIIFLMFIMMNYYNFKFLNMSYNNKLNKSTNDSKFIHNFWPLN
nr:ATP synthase F0 subunit 8 [Silo pallipes]